MVSLNRRRSITIGSGDCLAEGQPCGGGKGTCIRNVYDNQLFCSMNLPKQPQRSIPFAGKTCTSAADCFTGLTCVEGRCSSSTLPFEPSAPKQIPFEVSPPSYLSPMDVWAKTQVAQLMNMPKYFDEPGKTQMILWGANKTPILSFDANKKPVVGSEAACIHCILTHQGNPDYCRNICRYWA